MKLKMFLRLCIKTRSRESNCQNRGQRGEGTEGSQGGETGEVPQGQGGKAGQQESTAGPDTESKGQGGGGGGRKGAALVQKAPVLQGWAGHWEAGGRLSVSLCEMGMCVSALPPQEGVTWGSKHEQDNGQESPVTAARCSGDTGDSHCLHCCHSNN